MNPTEVKIKKDIRLLSKIQIEELVVALGEKKFRAGQIYEWLWQRSATSFEE
jgi:23S rRNA (adenine2503-C2)-methyltransferase